MTAKILVPACRFLAGAATALVLAGCQATAPGGSASRAFQACEEPRPEFCTYQYDPVCATKQEPNGETEWIVYGNACTACADPEVVGYKAKAGECKSD
ncbi:hypothetical protein ACXYTJ_08535 [Gilvimarinus sp. F26214L]|uniref:hypothetical protein n=1 Tax=Gilvimarinus sp. DZF01 TaxID=3461371 RepID=UPI0040454579